jgi:hypothetical protein
MIELMARSWLPHPAAVPGSQRPAESFLNRLYDELTSSHATVHGDNDNALAVGFVMVNLADDFISPGRQATDTEPVVDAHRQPYDTERTLAKVREINRRPGPSSGQASFDALGVMVVNMRNDDSPVRVGSMNRRPRSRLTTLPTTAW